MQAQLWSVGGRSFTQTASTELQLVKCGSYFLSFTFWVTGRNRIYLHDTPPLPPVLLGSKPKTRAGLPHTLRHCHTVKTANGKHSLIYRMIN